MQAGSKLSDMRNTSSTLSFSLLQRTILSNICGVLSTQMAATHVSFRLDRPLSVRHRRALSQLRLVDFWQRSASSSKRSVHQQEASRYNIACQSCVPYAATRHLPRHAACQERASTSSENVYAWDGDTAKNSTTVQ